MLALFLRWIASVCLAIVLCLPVSAQAPAPDAAKPAESASRSPPAPQYALAVIATILVLVIICMPTRKRWS